MNFKTGDKVKIKSWDEISKLGTPSKEIEGRVTFINTEGIIFNEGMVPYCGMEIYIDGPTYCFDIPTYHLVGVPYTWVEDWLEKVEK